jgi:hypothetical protein
MNSSVHESYILEVRTVLDAHLLSHPNTKALYRADHVFHAAVTNMITTLAAVAQAEDNAGKPIWVRQHLIQRALMLLLSDYELAKDETYVRFFNGGFIG